MSSPILARVLIVDDEIDLLNSLAEKLAKQGYHTAKFSSPREALQSLEEQQFDLLLTDLMMPEMDGIALLEAALKIDPTLVGIVMTGQATVQTAINALKMGALDYILKPFKLNSILPALARALEVRRLRQENIQLRETLGIYELCTAIAFTLDPQILLNKVVDAAVQQCEAEEASIMLPTEDGSQLRVTVARGNNRGQLLGECIPIEDGIAGWVARNREPLVLGGEVHDPRFAPLHPRGNIRGAICVPMVVGGQLIGVLNVNATRRPQPFTLGQVKALTILANTGAAALQSARLYTELQKAEQSLREQLCLASLMALVNQAFVRSNELQEGLRGCAEALVQNLGAASCHIWICESAKADLVLQAKAGLDTLPGTLHACLGPDQGVIATIATTGMPFQTNDAATTPGLIDSTLADRESLVAFAGYPLHVADELLGVMALFAPRPLTQFTRQALAAVAGQIALGIRRARSEEALRQSEQRYRHLFDTAPDLICTLAADGTFLSLNPAFEAMFGWPVQAWIGRSFQELVHPDDLALAREHFLRVAQGKHVQAFPERAVARSGKVLNLEITASPQVHDGRPEGILAIVRDRTELKHLEAKYLQAQKMDAFGQLAGGVAHDFNNLLTIINGYSEILLSEDSLSPDQRGDLLREIRRAGERAASLTRQLLAFSRKQVFQIRELDLNTLVREMQKMLRRLIGEDIDLATSLDPNLSLVRADPAQIEQVIMNLAVNARDAMPMGGQLTIETRCVRLSRDAIGRHADLPTGEYVLLAVSDTGCGMNETTKAKIFEPFFTTKEVGKGTGLGLATVHGIVKQSFGSIEVYSEVGHGTTFKIYLPAVENSVAASSRLQRTPLSIPKGTETILLTEDEDGVRATVTLALQSQGYTVLTARDGEEALQICHRREEPIHMLMTDVVMPKMSGRQLAERVKALRPSIKILFVSGYTDDAVLRHGIIEAGIAFLQKPFTPLGLAGKVREVLDMSRSPSGVDHI